MKRLILGVLAVATLTACTLAPHYQRPQSPVPDRWPADGASQTAATSVASGPSDTTAAPGVSADQIGWRDFFADPRLQRLIEIALDYNRQKQRLRELEASGVSRRSGRSAVDVK